MKVGGDPTVRAMWKGPPLDRCCRVADSPTRGVTAAGACQADLPRWRSACLSCPQPIGCPAWGPPPPGPGPGGGHGLFLAWVDAAPPPLASGRGWAGGVPPAAPRRHRPRGLRARLARCQRRRHAPHVHARAPANRAPVPRQRLAGGAGRGRGAQLLAPRRAPAHVWLAAPAPAKRDGRVPVHHGHRHLRQRPHQRRHQSLPDGARHRRRVAPRVARVGRAARVAHAPALVGGVGAVHGARPLDDRHGHGRRRGCAHAAGADAVPGGRLFWRGRGARTRGHVRAHLPGHAAGRGERGGGGAVHARAAVCARRRVEGGRQAVRAVAARGGGPARRVAGRGTRQRVGVGA